MSGIEVYTLMGSWDGVGDRGCVDTVLEKKEIPGIDRIRSYQSFYICIMKYNQQFNSMPTLHIENCRT